MLKSVVELLIGQRSHSQHAKKRFHRRLLDVCFSGRRTGAFDLEETVSIFAECLFSEGQRPSENGHHLISSFKMLGVPSQIYSEPAC